MRKKLVLLSTLGAVAAVTIVLSCLQPNKAVSSYPDGTPMMEGSGVNPGSRKYYEYQRQRDPRTGVVDRYAREHAAEFVSRLPKNESRSVAWTNRGPVNKGGRTRAFAIDVEDENILLAGAVTGGMWRSTDAGASWEKTTGSEQLHSVSCVVQDKRPGHEDEWYYGTGEEFYGVVSGTSFTSLLSGDGIFYSDDHGQTWEQLLSTASGTPQDILVSGSYDYVWNIAIDHTDLINDVIYAAVYNGIIRSEDGGDSWEQVLGFGPAGSVFTDVMITPSGALYATLSFANGANPGGIYRSTDGIEWFNITPEEFYSQRRTVMCFNPMNENEVYFLTEMNNDENDLGHTLYKYTYISGDGTFGGGSWENRSANLPDETCELNIGSPFEFGTFRSQSSYDLCIAHHPTENILFIGGTNVYRGMDAFATDSNQWIGGYRCNEADPKDYTYPNHHSDEHGFVFLPSNPDVMYNFNDGGLYRTNDCLADSVQWTPLNNGYVTTQFYTTHLEQGMATSDFVFGGMQDNGTWLTNSDNNALTWKEVHADDGAFGALPYGRDFVITSSQLGRIYKKEIAADGSLVNTKRIDPQNGPSALFINPLLLDPWTSNDLYIAGNKTIWWLPDVAAIEVDGEYYEGIDNDFWVNISESIIPTAAGSISCLDKAYSNNSMIYYGSTSGRAWRLDDCFADEPVKTEITGDEFPEGAYMSCITVNDLQVDEVICSFSNYNVPSIFHSTDGGTSWTNVSGNLEENPDGSGAGPGVYWVEIYPSEPAIYFAATSAGLFSTTQLDGANTIWEMEGASTIGNVVVNMVTARPFDGTIAVGTHGNGIYSGSLPPVDAVRIDEAIASQAWIESYPNPFDDALTFNFVVTENATLSVYDVSGRLVNEWKLVPSSAKQNLRWIPASPLAPGVYLYSLQSQRRSLTGKVVKR